MANQPVRFFEVLTERRVRTLLCRVLPFAAPVLVGLALEEA